MAVIFCILMSSQLTAQNMQIQGAQDNTQVYSGVVYGPIDQSDTLWRIASRYKQDNRFTVFQTMLAIYELNQQAFENGNFNTMVNGATLQLPSDRYIARMDPQRARAKAEQDDRAFGKISSRNPVSPNAVSDNVEKENLKPELPLVNQQDLSNTQSQLQSQLNTLRKQQQVQFEQLKNQVAASISSVEILLTENKKLNDQLIKIDQNNRSLTETVETELQTQIDQQVTQLSQLIALVKDAEQRRIDEESQSIMQLLSSPTALIIIMSVVTLLLIAGLALFLLRRSPATPSDAKEPAQNSDIVDDDLVIGELGDEIDQDSDDLLAALAADDDLEEDDILSDALEDDDAINSLSDADLAGNLDDDEQDSLITGADEDFAKSLDDLNDDMLVPDSPEVADVLEDTDFEVDLTSIINEESDAFVESDDSDSTSVESQGKADNIESAKADTKKLNEQSNKNELTNAISVDASDDSTPAGIDLDKHGEIDENTLEQIETQIEDKNVAISRMADEILDELDQVPSDSADIDELLTKDDIVANTASLTDTVPESSVSERDEGDQDDATEDAVKNSFYESEVPDESTMQTEPDMADIADEITELSNDIEAKSETPETQEIRNSEIEPLGSAKDDTPSDDAAVLDERQPDTNAQNDQVTALADDLLKELEESDEEEALDDTPHDIEDDIKRAQYNKPSYTSREDELLEDIPSFTSAGMGSDKKDKAVSKVEPLRVKKAAEADKSTTPVADAADQQVFEKTNPSENLPNDINQISKLSTEASTADAANDTEELKEEPTDDSYHEDSDDEDPDEDVLSSLPDLDNWLDEDEEALKNELEELSESDDGLDLSALDLDLEDIDTFNSDDSDDELMQKLDDANFDDMLKDLSDNNDAHDVSNSDDPFKDAGLDLEALLTDNEPAKSNTPASNIEDAIDDFVDVEDLLKESEALPERKDEDLSFESSLDKMMSKNKINNDLSEQNIEGNVDQASNLDLAQVYIDMEDFDAAQELLDEVVLNGSAEQQKEAKDLLIKIV